MARLWAEVAADAQVSTLSPSMAVQHSRRLIEDERTRRTQRSLRSCAGRRATRNNHGFMPQVLGPCSGLGTSRGTLLG
jgi:hypothetical protein